MKILITGSQGFVGRHFCRFLHDHNISFTALCRAQTPNLPELPFNLQPCDLNNDETLRKHMQDITHIVHLAGRAHHFDADNQNAAALYFSANVQTTEALIQAALEQQAQLIYISTVKVNGEQGHFKIDDPANAQDLYAQSKHQAEQLIIKAHQNDGLSYNIVRPTLIYGEGAKGNLDKLMQAITRGLPLPFASIKNARSMIHVDNLSALLLALIKQDKARNSCLFAADQQTLSTPELIQSLAQGLERPARLFPFPLSLLRIMAKCANKSDLLARITGSLTVDISPLANLDYQEVIDSKKGLKQMAQAFKAKNISS